MKEIVDKLGSLDLHRDIVVPCLGVREPDRMVTLSKETFATIDKGPET
jgi:transposase